MAALAGIPFGMVVPGHFARQKVKSGREPANGCMRRGTGAGVPGFTSGVTPDFNNYK